MAYTTKYRKKVQKFAEGGAVGDDYNTPLTQAAEGDFQRWKKRNAPDDSGVDYDLRGAYKAGSSRDAQSGHWKDRYKKPNHPTFSDESQYAKGDQRDRAGHWIGDTFVPPAIK
jgi:hypothetical protein